MDKQVSRDKLIEEIKAVPQDRIGELYDIIHYFRLGLGLERREREDIKKSAQEFFGIWKDITLEERTALEEIQFRREQTLRERNL